MKDELIEEVKNLINLPEDKHTRFHYLVMDIKEDDILYNLIEELKEIDSQKEFDSKMQFVGYSGGTVTYQHLALWLVNRAKRTTSTIAVEDLLMYLENDKFSAYFVMWLDGIFLGKILEIESNFDIRNACHIPVDSVANEVNRFSFNPFNHIKASAVLVHKFEHNKIHIIDDDREQYNFADKYMVMAEDIRLLMTICGDHLIGVQSTSVNVITEDGTPNLQGITTIFTNYRKTKLPHHITDQEFEKLQALYMKLAKTENKEFVRNVLRRLNEYATLRDNTDRAITIRTILESLFLDEGTTSEIAFQLALRVSRYSADTLDERNILFKDIKKLYSWCSKAVHTGKLELKKGEEEKFNSILNTVVNIVKIRVSNTIENENIDWQSVVLS